MTARSRAGLVAHAEGIDVLSLDEAGLIRRAGGYWDQAGFRDALVQQTASNQRLHSAFDPDSQRPRDPCWPRNPRLPSAAQDARPGSRSKGLTVRDSARHRRQSMASATSSLSSGETPAAMLDRRLAPLNCRSTSQSRSRRSSKSNRSHASTLCSPVPRQPSAQPRLGLPLAFSATNRLSESPHGASLRRRRPVGSHAERPVLPATRRKSVRAMLLEARHESRASLLQAASV